MKPDREDAIRRRAEKRRVDLRKRARLGRLVEAFEEGEFFKEFLLPFIKRRRKKGEIRWRPGSGPGTCEEIALSVAYEGGRVDEIDTFLETLRIVREKGEKARDTLTRTETNR